jgi:hypothetical protein
MGKRKFGESKQKPNTKFLKQAQEMQKNMMKAQEELGEQELKSSTGGGLVELLADGHGEIKSIKLNHEMLELDEDDAETLADAIMAGLSDISTQSKKIGEDMMGNSGLNLPGLF